MTVINYLNVSVEQVKKFITIVYFYNYIKFIAIYYVIRFW